MWPFSKIFAGAFPKYDMAAEFDIEGMPVVSIERNMRGQTVICCGPDYKEWQAFTDDQTHRDLCLRLRQKLQSRNK